MNPGIEAYLFFVGFLLPGEVWCIWHNVLRQCWVWHDSLEERNKSAPEQRCSMWDFDILKLFSASEARLQSDVSDSPPMYLMVVLTCPCVPASVESRYSSSIYPPLAKRPIHQPNRKFSIDKYPKWWWSRTEQESPLFCVIVSGMLLLRKVQVVEVKLACVSSSAVYIAIQLWIPVVPWASQTLQILLVHQDSACLWALQCCMSTESFRTIS